MKTIKWNIYIVGLIIALLSSCKIENPLIYSKNYSVGHNDLLKLDGYYIDSELLTTSNTENKEWGTILTCPLFFYEDGTVKIWPGLKNEKVADSLLLNNKKWGFTGIYKIVNDSLYIEYWIGDSGTGNLYRQSLVLKITNGKLLLIGKLNDKKEVINIKDKNKRSFIFRKSLKKPIIKRNWIKERKKWNK
jgi:hypothetical protein